jgi:hypothetical protein
VGVRGLSLAAVGSLLLLAAGCATKECVPSHADAAGVKSMNHQLTYDIDDPHGPIRRAILKLGGQFCEFDLPGVEQALLRVTGVKAVDLRTMKGAVMVTYEAGNVSPTAMLSAVRSVKGDGYYCTAKIMPD